jgi:ubiquinone/menaquinone biosynthesis C-methylase UbiE
MAAAAFDRLAGQYDTLWTGSANGRWQRQAVWRRIDFLFRPGQSVLDLGCGTGHDALHLAQSGVEVQAIDASPAMVRIARERGVHARCQTIEDLDGITGFVDGAISNFGALNCVPNLESVACALGRLVRPGGHVAVCLMGPFCAWETCHYLKRAQFRKAFRRWRRGESMASIGVRVSYPSVHQLLRTFRQDFRLVGWYGIGLFVPPSYVRVSERAVERLAAIDRQLAHLPLLRALSDHRLLVFHRI